MTDADLAHEIARLTARNDEITRTATFPRKLRPRSPLWNEYRRNEAAIRVLCSEIIASTPPPPPPPPPPTARRAPRAYNSTPSADARFCMSPEYGVRRATNGEKEVDSRRVFADATGVFYDEAGRDLGGRTKTIVPELKGANSMDGREPCDTYVGPTGRTIGGLAGYPEASFEG